MKFVNSSKGGKKSQILSIRWNRNKEFYQLNIEKKLGISLIRALSKLSITEK